MATKEMKKCITMMMTVLMIMFVVTQICDATQSIDISSKDYCARCLDDCFSGCLGEYVMGCTRDCMSKKCRCCNHNPPSC